MNDEETFQMLSKQFDRAVQLSAQANAMVSQVVGDISDALSPLGDRAAAGDAGAMEMGKRVYQTLLPIESMRNAQKSAALMNAGYTQLLRKWERLLEKMN